MSRTTAGAGWLLYSISGAGKTAAPGPLFDGRGTVIEYQPDSHLVMGTVYDCAPGRVVHSQKLEDALKVISRIKPDEGPVLLDDLHYMITHYGQRGPDFWNRMEKALYGLAEASSGLASKGVQVFVTCLEQGPRDGSRGSIPGGPLLPGQMTQQFAGLFHIVTRMVPQEDATIPGHNFWLDFGSDPQYVGRSRDLATKIKRFPPFVPEFLRKSGVQFQSPLLEKHEALVEKLAKIVEEEYENMAGTAEQCNALLRELRSRGLSVGKARQVVLAGLTRGALRYADGVL
jgi:hypothetical protein